jgi:hypothetical protein
MAFLDTDTEHRADGAPRTSWSLLTNHAQVLLCLARDNNVRLRDVAVTVGITERAAQSIVADLVTGGYVVRTKIGRRNHYVVHDDRPLHHDGNDLLTVGGLLNYLQSVPLTVSFVPPVGASNHAGYN